MTQQITQTAIAILIPLIGAGFLWLLKKLSDYIRHRIDIQKSGSLSWHALKAASELDKIATDIVTQLKGMTPHQIKSQGPAMVKAQALAALPDLLTAGGIDGTDLQQMATHAIGTAIGAAAVPPKPA